MSKQINQYTKTRDRNSIQTEDLLDLDSTDDKGGAYESAKLSVSELSQYIANIFTFYRLDGSFPSGETRTVNFNSGKLRFEAGGDVELRGIGLSDYGFIVQNLNNLQRAKLGTDDSLDTGILSLSDANGEFLIASEGKVGIGVSSPNAPLDVNGNIYQRSGILYINSAISTYNSNDISINYPAGKKIVFNSGSEKMRLDLSGNLGIGTIPTSKLHVKGSGSTSATTNFLLENSIGDDLLKVTDDGITILNSTNLGDKLILYRFQSGFDYGFEVQTGDLRNYVTSASKHSWGYKTSGSFIDRMTLNGTGLGVGINTPNANIHVKGFQSTVTTNIFLAENSNGDSLFKINGDGTTGVGIALPTSKLHVKGSGSTSATTNFLLENSIGDDLFRVTDDGQVDSKEGYWLDGYKTLKLAGDKTNLMLGYGTPENISKINNTAVGYGSMGNSQSSFGCSALGQQSLFSNVSGRDHTAIGLYSLFVCSSGSGNTALGSESLSSLTSGTDNIAIGLKAGFGITSGNRNIIIGSRTGTDNSAISNSIGIGAYVNFTGSNQFVLGAQGSGAYINEMYLGAGVEDILISPKTFKMQITSIKDGQQDTESDYDFIIASSQGTGTGKGGDIIFKTAPSGASGSTQNSLVTSMTIKESGILNIANIPTSSAGLSTGDIWNDAGTLKIV